MARIPILEPPEVSLAAKADLITDPVERLRFLRQEMRPKAEPVKVIAKRSAMHGVWIAAGVLALIGISPFPTGTAETLKKERMLVVPETARPAGNVAIQKVWLVEKSDALEVFSNGLRVDLTFSTFNRPRKPFPVFSISGGVEQGVASAPVGIVFHTTESRLAPFAEEQNRRLRVIGRSLIELVRRERSYHYVIDRFGRVYRVVEESDAANHAGKSVWGDARGVYVNLNDSFLGVSFEGQTDAVDEMTPAQMISGRMLTEMLRSRYNIPAEACVTHAQVSVNPMNMRIGDHTDWAGKFPFAQMGLPDNYALPLASLYVFGFDYDSLFVKATGGKWRGVEMAEMWLGRQAAAEGLETRRYRAILQHRYKDIETALREKGEEANP